MENEWIDIQGFDGDYTINKDGVVRSFLKSSRINGASFYELKPSMGLKGYFYISLKTGNKHKAYLLHRLLAISFISNPENKPCINHKNGIKTDNRIENLEWCTYYENNLHAKLTGLHKMPKGQQNPLSIEVLQHDRLGRFIKSWRGIRGIERELKIDASSITACCRGKRRCAGGYIWQYALVNRN